MGVLVCSILLEISHAICIRQLHAFLEAASAVFLDLMKDNDDSRNAK